MPQSSCCADRWFEMKIQMVMRREVKVFFMVLGLVSGCEGLPKYSNRDIDYSKIGNYP
jgi:hypothetical protein